MASIIPKLKLFLFVSFIGMLINIMAFVMSFAMNGSANIDNFIAQVGTSFLPFVDIVSLVFLGFPVEVFAIFTVISIITGAIKVVMLETIIASHIPTVNV